MISPAGAAYTILATIVAYYTLTCEKEDRISALILTGALLAAAIKFYLLPFDLSVAIIVPFVYFLPIVTGFALTFKFGKRVLPPALPWILALIPVVWLFKKDPVELAGNVLFMFPVPVIASLFSRGDWRSTGVASAVFVAIAGLATHFKMGKYLLMAVFCLSLFALFRLPAYEELAKEETFEKIPKKKLELYRKLMHSFVFLVFLPEWLLEWMTEVGVDNLGEFVGMELSVGDIGISYVRIGVLIMLGSLLPVFIAFELLRLKGGISLISRKLLRESEYTQMAGNVYIVGGILAIATFFELDIFLASAAIAFIADAAAALVGINFGRHKIVEGRSLEGVVAGFVAAFLSALVFVPLPAALVAATVIEIADVIVDGHASDNVIFPILAGVTLYLCM